MSQSAKKVLIMAGGTGGHVFPALATAQVLMEQGVEVEWLGTAKRIEAEVVPAAGIHLNTIDIEGLRGKGKLGLITAPFRLMKAIAQARNVLKRFQPDAVLGMGGFASGPGGLAARMMGIPLVIHEQNALAGMTNKALSRMATKVLQAFPGAFDGQDKGAVVGNPVRGPILQMQAPEQRFHERTGPLRLLVVGGSLGAKAINELMPQALAQLPVEQRPLVRHQTGKRHLDDTLQAYRDTGVEADVTAFIERMDEAYGWADLVVCRSGALTVSELAIAGVASVLVPYPFAVDDHQRVNAEFLVERGAAECVVQKALSVEKLCELLRRYNNRETLLQMAEAARDLGRPDASEQVARVCLEVMK